MLLHTPFRKGIVWLLLFGSTSVCILAQSHSLQVKKFTPPSEVAFPTIECIYQDNLGFMWFGTYGGLYRYDGYEIKHYYHDPDDSLTPGDNRVTNIEQDHDGNYWYGAQWGLHYFDARSETFKVLEVPGMARELRIVHDIEVDINGVVWIAIESGLYTVERDSANLVPVDLGFDHAGKAIILVQSLPGGGKVVAGRHEIFIEKESTFFDIEILNREDFHGEIIGAVLVDLTNYLWIGTEEGLHKYDHTDDSLCLFVPWPIESTWVIKKIFRLNSELLSLQLGALVVAFNTITEEFVDPILDDRHISSMKIGASIVDHQNRTWLGYDLGEVVNIDYEPSIFGHASLEVFDYAKNAITLFEIFEYQPGTLLIPTTRGNRLFSYNTGKIEDFPHRPTYNTRSWESGVLSFFETNDKMIWMGAAEGGVFLFDRNREKFVDIYSMSPEYKDLEETLIRAIFVDSKNNLWLVPWNFAPIRIDKNQRFTNYSDRINGLVDQRVSSRSIMEDSNGTIWIGTRQGLLKYNELKDSFDIYDHDAQDPRSISENTAFDIYEDSLGYIWTGSYGGGVNRLDPVKEDFIHFTVNDGLINNNIFSLLPDASGNLWMLSFNGISKFNPYTFEVVNYTEKNGLGSDQYDGFMYGVSPYDGKFFFAGNKGIDFFHPDSITVSDYVPKIVFTDFSLFNEPVSVRRPNDKIEDRYRLDTSITFAKEIILPYDQKVLSFTFAALDYEAPSKIEYAYMLEGFDRDWQVVENVRTATYTNLDPGHYDFQVKSTNSDGVWVDNVASISLVITPPWWATWWAYLLYVLFIASVAMAFYYYKRRRWILRNALAMQEQEAIRLKELDSWKTNIYTNITHEFRTPITVISGMASLVRDQPAIWLHKGTSMIENGAKTLLHLINQMLDLQALEAGKMDAKMVHGDIIPVIETILEPMKYLAGNKGLTLKVSHDVPSVMMDHDREKLDRILTNLVTNAIKYSVNGVVSLHTVVEAEEIFEISVSDQGVGISEEDLPHIFDRFFQVDASSSRKGEGTGIGLALVRDYVQLLGGKIDVESILGKGSTFRVTFPVTKQADADLSATHTIDLTSTGEMRELSKSFSRGDAETDFVIMVVEDHLEVREYIGAILEDRYHLSYASDGEEGFRQAIREVPDLIISDVMMPGMDGYTLCERLHEESLTSHIPVVLLTARADDDSRVTGYRKGADAYLVRPFLPEELHAQIFMLLEQRSRLQQAFIDNLIKKDEQETASDPFLSQIRSHILNHLSDEKMSVQQLCELMHISRSQLHKKVKAISGQSPSIFIRKIRLAEAHRMLANGHQTVAQVAYACGFQDPSYFSRVYKEEYGYPPSERNGK